MGNEPCLPQKRKSLHTSEPSAQPPRSQTSEPHTRRFDAVEPQIGWLLPCLAAVLRADAGFSILYSGNLARKMPLNGGQDSEGLRGTPVTQRRPNHERRKWVRLPLAIPVFVRSMGENEKESLEFATALNVSAGGALVVVRRCPVAAATSVTLEIPSAPLADGTSLPKASRTLRARIVRITHSEGYHLLGLKFSKPLISNSGPRPRKVLSPL